MQLVNTRRADIDTVTPARPGRSLRRLGTMPALARLAACDRGQDLIEYALLTAFIGVISIAAWSVIEGTLGTAYSSYDAGTQSIWASPNPQ